jgi:hypothetical protein
MEFSDNEAFQFLVDPFSGRIVLVIPAPMVCFEDIEAFKDFIETLKEAVPSLNVRAIRPEGVEKDNVKSFDPIDRQYAEKVIESWQSLVMENALKKTGPSLQKMKLNDSTLELESP